MLMDWLRMAGAKCVAEALGAKPEDVRGWAESANVPDDARQPILDGIEAERRAVSDRRVLMCLLDLAFELGIHEVGRELEVEPETVVAWMNDMAVHPDWHKDVRRLARARVLPGGFATTGDARSGLEPE